MYQCNAVFRDATSTLLSQYKLLVAIVQSTL